MSYFRKRKKKEEKLQVQVTELQAELAASQQQYNNLVNNMSAKVRQILALVYRFLFGLE